MEAAAEFEDQRSRFFSEHERFDDYMEMKEGLDLSYIPHFKEYMVSSIFSYYCRKGLQRIA